MFHAAKSSGVPRRLAQTHATECGKMVVGGRLDIFDTMRRGSACYARVVQALPGLLISNWRKLRSAMCRGLSAVVCREEGTAGRRTGPGTLEMNMGAHRRKVMKGGRFSLIGGWGHRRSYKTLTSMSIWQDPVCDSTLR